MINRSAIVVRAKQPFLDWLLNLPDPVGPDMTLDLVNHEPHVYLLPEYGFGHERDELIDQFYDIVFETELAGWWTEEQGWPSNRTVEMFKQWFDVQFHSAVEDLVDAPLLDEV
jgi:hypothetical protein